MNQMHILFILVKYQISIIHIFSILKYLQSILLSSVYLSCNGIYFLHSNLLYSTTVPNQFYFLLFVPNYQQFSSKKEQMTSHQFREHIQQVEEGQKNFGIVSSVKSLHKKVIGNGLVTQMDLFSVPVKFNINGNDVYQTFFGGLINLILIVICLVLCYFIMYPNGLQLNSQITQTIMDKDYGDNGQTLFDYTNEPIGFKGMVTNGMTTNYSSMADYATIYAYQVSSDGTTSELQVSNNCSNGYQFCIQSSAINQNAKIYGSPATLGSFYTYIQYQIIWCNSLDPSCPFPYTRRVQAYYSNFYKQKGGDLTEYKIVNRLAMQNTQYNLNVTRQDFNSNNLFFGHLADILSFDIYTYMFDDHPQTTYVYDMITPGNYTDTNFLTVRLFPTGKTSSITENFDDISMSLLFFLSVRQTFYFFVFLVLVSQYNQNAGFLEISDSLFYVDDPKTKKKYDFKSGFEIFLACLLHKHFLSNILNFILSKFGRTMNDFLPKKTISAIFLINKAEQLLQENIFYGNLNDLSMMESQGPGKVPINFDDQKQEGQDEDQVSYFPFQPTDSQKERKQKQLKREAFQQFCQANEFVCAKRKNRIYKVITNKKLKYILAHQLQSQFKQFVRNVGIQQSEDIYKEEEEEEISEIKVNVHDSSHHQMTAETLLKRRTQNN